MSESFATPAWADLMNRLIIVGWAFMGGAFFEKGPMALGIAFLAVAVVHAFIDNRRVRRRAESDASTPHGGGAPASV